MFPKRTAIALAAAAQLGVVSAQDEDAPQLIPPAPADAAAESAGEETAGDLDEGDARPAGEAAGPVLVPPAPAAPLPEPEPEEEPVPEPPVPEAEAAPQADPVPEPPVPRDDLDSVEETTEARRASATAEPEATDDGEAARAAARLEENPLPGPEGLPLELEENPPLDRDPPREKPLPRDRDESLPRGREESLSREEELLPSDDDEDLPRERDETLPGEEDMDQPVARRTRFRPVPPRPAAATNFPAETTPRETDVPSDAAPESTPPGTADLDEETRSRYRLAGGEWWYQLRSGHWKYYRGGAWRDFDPATFVPLRADGEDAGEGPPTTAGGAEDARAAAASVRRSYTTLRPVNPPADRRYGRYEFEAGGPRRIHLPPGYIPPGHPLVPADAVDPRTGLYYGPGEDDFPPPDDGPRDWRRGSVRSIIRGFFGR